MQYTPGSDNGLGAGNSNSSSFVNRREMRASNDTGVLPIVTTGRNYAGSLDLEKLIASLKELFAQDRQVASQPDSARCGICYLYFTASDLYYREEEGFYVCKGCERALGKTAVPMLRRQQKR
jgi:hypothetical protein